MTSRYRGKGARKPRFWASGFRKSAAPSAWFRRTLGHGRAKARGGGRQPTQDQKQRAWGPRTAGDGCPHVTDYSISILPDPVWTSIGTPPPPTLPRTSFLPIEPCTVTGWLRLMDPEPVWASRSNEAFWGRRSWTLPEPV